MKRPGQPILAGKRRIVMPYLSENTHPTKGVRVGLCCLENRAITRHSKAMEMWRTPVQRHDPKKARSMLRAVLNNFHVVNYALVVVATVAFVISFGFIDWRGYIQSESETLRADAKILSSNLQSGITQYKLMARGLNVEFEIEKVVDQQEYARIARLIRGDDSAVMNLAYIEDYKIRMVYPVEENAHLIGRDLREVSDQRQALEETIRSGDLTVDGPVKLLQGGHGLIFRAPIHDHGLVDENGNESDEHSDPHNKIVTVVVSTDRLLMDAGIQDISADKDVALRTVNADAVASPPFYGESDIFAQRPVIESFYFGDDVWEVAVLPKGGWSAGYSLPYHWLFAIVVGGTIWILSLSRQHRENKRAEKAETEARNAEAKMLTAIEALPEGFLLFDADNRLIMFNETIREMYEETAPAIKIGATLEEIVRYGLKHGDYVEAVGREEEWLQELQDRLYKGETAIEYPLKNGRWVRSYNVLTADGGRVGLRIDVTTLRKQQALLEEANAELRDALEQRDAAEKRFFDIAEVSKDWFWEQDKELRFTFLSSSFDKNMNMDSTRFIGRTRREVLDGVKRKQKTSQFDWLESQMAERRPFENFVYQAADKSGLKRWIRISGAPVFDADGKFAGYRGVGSDISAFYQAMNDANAANAAKTEFLSVVSHELRTPLTVILGYNAFLKMPDLLPSIKSLRACLDDPDVTPKQIEQRLDVATTEVKKLAEKMDGSGQHLLKLINELLDLSKIESGELELKPTDLSVDDMVRSVADQFKEVAAKKNLKLTFQSNGEGVFADEMRLKQVLINLVGNAVKFTREGTVHISAEKHKGEVSISVTDTGCGIPNDMQEAIFDKFKQVEASGSRSVGGTGLGLTITRHLIELQHGRIQVESQPDEGSTFTVYLPSSTRFQQASDVKSSDTAA